MRFDAYHKHDRWITGTLCQLEFPEGIKIPKRCVWLAFCGYRLPVDPLVKDLDLCLRACVIVYDHFSATHDGRSPDLARIQPTHMAVNSNAVIKLQV